MSLLLSLKKFFIDNPIAWTKKVWFWLNNRFVGLRFSFLYDLLTYRRARRLLRVGKDGRAEMLMAGVSIVAGCNLRCEYCSALSPHQSGFTPVEELLASFKEWSKKIRPKFFSMAGGEPLMHPELARIVRESAKIWNDSKLLIVTNGLLLERLKPEIFHAIKETGYEFVVSEHTFEPEHRKKLDVGYKLLNQEGIRFVVRPSRSSWTALYQYDDKGTPVPYTSNPKKAWHNCALRTCVFMSSEKLFTCCSLFYAHDGIQKSILSAEVWKAALTYQPLTLQSTPEAIVEHLRRKVIPACTVCAEKYLMVPSRQMPLMKDKCCETADCKNE
jgi:hypothetical protein